MKLDLNKGISYRKASLRFFDMGEYHCTRMCNDDVLFLVYEGVLNIFEDGKEYNISSGQYHITRQGTYQEGKIPSDSPKSDSCKVPLIP